MNLLSHELIHLITSLLAAYLIYRRFNNRLLALIGGLLGGFLIDLDHLFDYVLAFGSNFNLQAFLKGYQFVKIDKIFIPLHAWELPIILFLVVVFVKKINLKLKTVIAAFALGLFFHLAIDTVTNEQYFKSYFLSYRASKGFELKELVSQDHYKYHVKKKKSLGF